MVINVTETVYFLTKNSMCIGLRYLITTSAPSNFPLRLLKTVSYQIKKKIPRLTLWLLRSKLRILARI